MIKSILAASICGLIWLPGLASAQTSAGSANPIKPGGARITTRVPDADKWDAKAGANGARIFVCKKLACADPVMVTITIGKTLARHPDPKALEKFAKVDLPKQTRASAAAAAVLSDGAVKIETLNSETTKLKGYPSVVNATKIAGAKKALYMHTAIIFSGPAMVRVMSTSPNRELGRKSMNEFVEAMTIVEGPPAGTPAVPSPVPPSQTQVKSL